MIIGVDVDGVEYDFTHGMRVWVIDKFGYHPKYLEEPSEWNFPEWEFEPGQLGALMREAVTDGHLFKWGAPFDGVAEGLKRLREAGHTVVAVTARGDIADVDLATKLTQEWCLEHGLEHDAIIFSADKTAISVDVFIDDAPHNYEKLVAAGVDTYLRSHRYNLTTECPPERRVANFAEFVDSVLARNV